MYLCVKESRVEMKMSDVSAVLSRLLVPRPPVQYAVQRRGLGSSQSYCSHYFSRV